MPPHDTRDPVTGLTYEQMIRDVYFAVAGDIAAGTEGLVEEVRSLKKWRQEAMDTVNRRWDRFHFGIFCGLVPSLAVVVIEHFWK